MDAQAVEREVLAIVTGLVAELRTALPESPVSLEDSLDRDLAIGSLERVELLLRLEKAFGVHVGDDVMVEADTVRDLVAAVLASKPGIVEATLPVVPVLPGGAAPPASARTLTEVLRWHAEADPERTHIVLRTETGLERPISYARLWSEAERIGGALRERGVDDGESVAIMLRTEEAFFSVFFGILVAGGIPVPIYPPFRADRLEEYAARQTGILSNAATRCLVTFGEAERIAGLLRSRVRSLREVIAVDQLTGGGRWVPSPRLVPDAPALIQYTSGSTGEPKGVVLTHANILANIRALGQAIELRPDDVCVSWLPLYHDMGLIGAWLGALYHGVPTVIMSPLAFLARPARWLWALHTHRGTLSPAPNFAFDLCVKRITDDELEGLDLSAWRLALNGSEPVSEETIERFTRRFARYGFTLAAMCPVYGLAESSVGLTMTPPGRGPRVDRIARQGFERTRTADPARADDPNALQVVSCGRPLPDHEVRIVAGAGHTVGERVEGHVLFRGPSVTHGYFRNPEATRAVQRNGWMDSGDLGYAADGELYVTGRQKDVIIKGGRNIHPQEIEEIVGDVPGIRKGCVAAFGISDPAIGTERLVVVAESRQTRPDARERLRASVVDRVVTTVGIPPDTVVIARPGSVLKTSSGKIRRSATRDAYVEGRLARRRSIRTQRLRLALENLGARVRETVRSAGRLAFAARAGIVLITTVPPLYAAVALLPGGRAVGRAVKLWCRLVLRLIGCRLDVQGLENIPRGGAVVYAANHSSYLDAVALLAAIPADFRFVAKKELLATPIVGTMIRRMGHVTVDRVDLSRSVADAERVSALLRRGGSLFFFPEGTFLRTPRLLPFKLGAFKAAVDTHCAVIPVAIRGTRDVLPADTWLPRRGAIRVTIGGPLVPGNDGWREMVRLRDHVRDVIARRLDQAIPS